MSDDPLGELLDQLLDAHDGLKDDASRGGRRDVPPPGIAPKRTARVARGRWRLAFLVGVAVIASISTAAAIVEQTQRSAPLSGRLPRELLGTRYVLEVGPDLMAGQVAWCITLRALGSGDQPSLGPGSCGTPQGAVIARGGLAAVSASTGGLTGLLLYAIVDRRVAALRAPDGRRIIPVHSPRLPGAWTAAVTIQAHPRPQAGSGIVALTPLSRSGTRLRSAAPEPVEATRLRVRRVNPLRPPSQGCAIDVRAAPGIRLGRAWALRGVAPATLATAEPAFLSCYSVTFTLHGRPGVAALLLDGRSPGRLPADLPNTHPLPGRRGVVAGPGAENLGFGFTPGGQLIAERVGSTGWLVMQISATTATSQTVLQYLQART